MLGSFNNCNIIKVSHKATSSDNIEKNNQVLIYGISNNIDELVQTGKYSSINKTDTTTMVYYVIKLLSEAYTLQEDTNHNVQISIAGKLVSKGQ